MTDIDKVAELTKGLRLKKQQYEKNVVPAVIFCCKWCLTYTSDSVDAAKHAVETGHPCTVVGTVFQRTLTV